MHYYLDYIKNTQILKYEIDVSGLRNKTFTHNFFLFALITFRIHTL